MKQKKNKVIDAMVVDGICFIPCKSEMHIVSAMAKDVFLCNQGIIIY
jgi:hypothetical protein